MAKDTSDVEDVDLAPIESLTAFGSTSSAGVPSAEVRGRVLGTPGTEPEPPPPPSIESLTRPPAAVQEGLSSLMSEHIRRQERLNAQTEARLEEDRARTKRAYDATGIQPGEFQPWDADKQKEKYSTAPLDAFGSLGSVFAMVASAFTRDPMTNALNGAAAAMTAIRDSDEKNYVRAYDAWKSNTDLAVKRHNIQQQAYSNAITLMDSDLRLGTAKAAMEAARFGDQKSLFLINNGMIPEWVDLQIKNTQAAKGLVEASEVLTLDSFKQETIKKMAKQWDEEDASDVHAGMSRVEIAGRRLARVNRIFGKMITPQQEAWGLLLDNMSGQPFEKILEVAQQRGLFPRYGVAGGNPNLTLGRQQAEAVRAYGERLAAEVDENGKPKYTPDQIADLKAERAQDLARKAAPGQGAQRAQTRENIRADVEDEHGGEWTPGQIDAETDRRVRRAQTGLTEYQESKIGEKKDKVASVVNQIDRALQIIEEAGKRGESVTGVVGAFGRLKEFATGGSTDKAEFEQMIRTIQQEVPGILKGSVKLDASERKVIDVVVPGLGFLKNQEQVHNGLKRLRDILEKKSLVEENVPLAGTATKPKVDKLPVGEVVWQKGVPFQKQPDGSMKQISPEQVPTKPAKKSAVEGVETEAAT